MTTEDNFSKTSEPALKKDEQISLAIERTRMAGERTFLSWLRTGLTAVGGGIAIIKLISFHTEFHRWMAQMVGHLLIAWGIVTFIFSLVSYRKSCIKLEESQEYKHSLTGIILIVSVLVLLTLMLFFIN